MSRGVYYYMLGGIVGDNIFISYDHNNLDTARRLRWWIMDGRWTPLVYQHDNTHRGSWTYIAGFMWLCATKASCLISDAANLVVKGAIMLSAVASISLTRAVSSANCTTIVCLNVCDSELWADCNQSKVHNMLKRQGGGCESWKWAGSCQKLLTRNFGILIRLLVPK